MPCGGSVPPLVLQAGDECALAPSHLARQVAQNAILSKTAEFDCSQGVGDDLSLLCVVGGGASLEDLNSTRGLCSSGGLVRDHSSEGPPQDSGRSSVVDESPAGVSEESLPEEFGELDLVSEERAGNIDSLAPDNDDSLS